MTIDDNLKRAALVLIKRGQITQAEAAKLIGVSRQAIAYWVDGADTTACRDAYLAKLWEKATRKCLPF